MSELQEQKERQEMEYLAQLERQTVFETERDDLETSMKTKLIMMAVKYCKHYNSDIVIDINCIEKMMRMRQHDIYECVGFREYGTDHAGYVLSRYEDKMSYGKEPWKYYSAAVIFEAHLTSPQSGFYAITMKIVTPKEMIDFARKHASAIRHPVIPSQTNLWSH